MPNVRASSGMIGTTFRPMALSRSKVGQQPDKTHGGGNFAVPEPLSKSGKALQRAASSTARRLDDALGHKSAQLLAPFQQIL